MKPSAEFMALFQPCSTSSVDQVAGVQGIRRTTTSIEYMDDGKTSTPIVARPTAHVQSRDQAHRKGPVVQVPCPLIMFQKLCQHVAPSCKAFIERS
jgi:hypothetical protein